MALRFSRRRIISRKSAPRVSRALLQTLARSGGMGSGWEGRAVSDFKGRHFEGAIVLWAVAGGLGGRTGKAYMDGMTKAQDLQKAGQTGPNAELRALNQTQNGVLLHSLASLALLLILIDMIWKPGA